MQCVPITPFAVIIIADRYIINDYNGQWLSLKDKMIIKLTDKDDIL